MLICSLARVKVNTTLMIQFFMQEGRSLLTMAAQCGHKGLLKFLLHHGADAYQIDSVSRAMVVYSNHMLSVSIETKIQISLIATY